MERLEAYLKKRRALIDGALNRFLPGPKARPVTLHRAIRYSLFSGGKRLRPILVIEACRACGSRPEEAIRAACAVEMIHTSSLIHDDLPSMDNDDYRRGRPSCHRKFGEATAILAGDALLIMAFGVIAEGGGDRRLRRAISALSGSIGSLGMMGGQEEDLRKGRSLKKGDLQFITEKKTASLFEASLRLGAISARAGRDKEIILSDFGRFLGMAFQLMDDLFDNDGYARIIGREETQDKALKFIRKAKDRIRPFRNKARRLKEIADLVIKKKP